MNCIYFQGKSCYVDSINDAGDFEAVQRALDILNFSDEEKGAIWGIIAAILHLGNVSFKANDDGLAKVVDETHVNYCSKVLFWILFSTFFTVEFFVEYIYH